MATNDYLPEKYYWPIGYFYWPRIYKYWPLGFSPGIGEDRVFVEPIEDRTFIVKEDQRIFVVPVEDRVYTVKEEQRIYVVPEEDREYVSTD